MKRARTQSRGLQIFYIMGAFLVLFVQGDPVFAQGANDFFSVTSSNNLRTTSTAPSNPGFNPCPGDNGDPTSCTGTGLLSVANLGSSSTNTAGIFGKLGPGAITDNMFGVIAATNPDSSPVDVARCTPLGGAQTSPSPAGLIIGVNCGDLHLDPVSQGMAIPSGANTVSASFVSDTSMNSDFNQNQDGHVGFDITNTMTWDPTCGSPVCITLDQVLWQVTNLVPGGAGTLGTVNSSTDPAVILSQPRIGPGTGDQVFLIETQASFTNPDGVQFQGPIVSWRQHIVDPEMSGTATTGFTQRLSGSFVYNDNPAADFSCTDPQQGCSQYPNGQSQTIRSTGIGTPSENLP